MDYLDMASLIGLDDLLSGEGLNATDLVGNLLGNPLINEAISTALWITLLCLLPFLIVGILYCFCGLKMHRGLVVLDAAVVSGCIAMDVLIFLVLTSGGAVVSAVIGGIIIFIIAAIGFGILAYKFPKVFICIHSFGVGFINGAWLFFLMGVPAIWAVVISLMIGTLLCILTALPQFTKGMIMGTHAFKGGFFIAIYMFWLTLALAGVQNAKGAFVMLWIALIAFAIGGFLLQYFGDKKNPVILFVKKQVVVYNYGNQPYNPNANNNGYQQQPAYQQQPGYQPVQQQPVANNPIANMAAAKLIGVEGAYKGASFDLTGAVVVGRDAAKCNIVYPSGTKGVSRIQCQFTRNPQTGAISVQDNGSSYGTSVNGVKLQTGQIMFLHAGDVIAFGENNVFKIEY